jgi:hypothetical protein
LKNIQTKKEEALHSLKQGNFELDRKFPDKNELRWIIYTSVLHQIDETKDQLLLTTGCGGADLIQSVNFRTNIVSCWNNCRRLYQRTKLE